MASSKTSSYYTYYIGKKGVRIIIIITCTSGGLAINHYTIRLFGCGHSVLLIYRFKCRPKVFLFYQVPLIKIVGKIKTFYVTKNSIQTRPSTWSFTK